MTNPHWAFEEIRNPTCDLCDLGNINGDLRCLVGVGPRDAELMLIGEAPGRREIQPDVRRPFAGPAGQYLDKVLENAGINRDEIFITNVICCHPPHDSDPTASQIKACRPFLDAQITTVKPKKIMALGNIALKALTGHSGISTYRGRPFTLTYNNVFPIEVTSSFHPAYVRRNPGYYPVLFTDLLRFKGGNYKNIELHYQPVEDMVTFRTLIRELLKSPEVSFDIETEYLDPWTGGKIICIGLSNRPGQAWCVPLEGKWATWTDEERAEIFRLLGAILSNPRIRIIAFNSLFDLKWLWTRNIPAKCDSDPMMDATLLDENLPHSLESTVQLYIDPDFTKPEPDKISTWPWEKIWFYNSGDTDWTLRLSHILPEKLHKEPTSELLLKKLIMPVQTKLLPSLELNGIYVHEDKLTEAEDKCLQEAEKWEEEIHKHVPKDYVLPVKSKKSLKRGFNPNSPKQLAHLLFDVMGFPGEVLTKGGDLSTKESVLIDLKNLYPHPILEAIVEYRKYAKYDSTYIVPWRELRDSNGFIHPHYHLRPVTGRLSSTDPNLQQTPRESWMRNCLGAPPGWLLLSADLSQIEMRLAAHYSHDENLIKVFIENRDVHLETAILVTGLPAEKVTKELRKKAKAVNFGLIYGMGARKLMEYAKEKYEVYITLDEATTWRKAFFTRYPRLLEWHRRQIKEVHEKHRVSSLIGRVRHLNNILSSDPQIVAEAERQSINSIDQGLASDITLLSAIEVDKVLPPKAGRLAGLVHDQALYIIREDVVDYWKDRIKSIMENPPLYKFTSERLLVPLEVGVTISPYWS